MDKLVFYTDHRGEYRWRYVSEGNNEPMADSGEGYRTEQDCVAGARRVVNRDIVFDDSMVAAAALDHGEDADKFFIRGEWQ